MREDWKEKKNSKNDPFASYYQNIFGFILSIQSKKCTWEPLSKSFYISFPTKDTCQDKRVSDYGGLDLINTKQSKEELPQDPGLEAMKKRMITGFFNFTQKTSISQRPPSPLKLAKGQHIPLTSFPHEEVCFRQNPWISNNTG